jgi:hypothetical protein
MWALSEFLLIDKHDVIGEVVLVVVVGVKKVDLAVNDLSVVRNALVPA